MKEQTGDLWKFHRGDAWIVITTNGFVKNNGHAVMGRGVAAQCAARFPEMPNFLGVAIQRKGNHVHTFVHPFRIFTFPVKHNWYERADLELITRSVEELIVAANEKECEEVYLPKPGCGNGGLDWTQVKPLLAKLDDRFTVVSLG